MARSERLERVAFWCAAAAAALVLWIPRYPPLVDLPQHAGEIRLLHDWFHDGFPWRRELQLQLFTPYLASQVLGALLTCVMSAVAAAKLVWSLAMLGTVYTSVRLRRLVGGSPRWDWLVLPGLFGTTFLWGLLPFMAAVPIGLYTLERWLVYVRAPSPRRALAVVALLVAMFFSHVLATAWVLSTAGLVALATARRDRWRWYQLVVRGLPLLAPLPLVVAWWYAPKMPAAPGGVDLIWQLDATRIVDFFPQLLGVTGSRVAIAVGLVIFGVPFIAGARLARDAVKLAPLAVTLVVLAVVPNVWFGNAWTYPRFFLLLGPSLVIALAGDAAARPARFARLRVLLPVFVIGWIAFVGVRMALFAGESADFVRLVARMPPEQRVLGIVLHPRSTAADISRAYLHFPVWYQAESGGLVDYSFAGLVPSVVQFRGDYAQLTPPGFEFAPALDWRRVGEFDSLLVRVPVTADDKPPFADPRLQLVDHEGTWWRYAPAR